MFDPDYDGLWQMIDDSTFAAPTLTRGAVLCEAIIQNRFEAFEALFELDQDENIAKSHNWTPIKLRDDINTVTYAGQGALNHAADREYPPLIYPLLAAGANAEITNSWGETPLHRAAKHDHVGNLEALIDGGARTRARNAGSQTPLMVAAASGAQRCLRLLLGRSEEADINDCDTHQHTPLILAATHNHAECVRMLLDTKVAKVNQSDGTHRTALHYAAASCGDVRKTVHHLMQHEADLEKVDFQDYTPLWLAVKHDMPQTVRCLLDYNSEFLSQDCKGWTSLHLAAFNGCTRAFKELHAELKKEAKDLDNLSAVANDYTVLHLAVMSENISLLDFVAEKMKHVTAVGKDGMTALHLAAERGWIDGVTCLSTRHPDLMRVRTSEGGMTAAHCAAAAYHMRIAAFLIDQGTPDIADNGKARVVHYAIGTRQYDALQMLAPSEALSLEDIDTV